ncbi:DNA polymerase IV [Halovivax gelatinilyticus]|uniref:DNA polymerase IV n=1 Tax=Halovivax gelatinilyticus TaxID=2961597 RepID=UPI0020CA969C|nr:DNA polymerase IV [Halovivax gelatinilyticus]
MPAGSRLPGIEPDSDDADPIVLHVDADCFYAACERLREPALRGEPLVVGMGYEEGDDTGAVATASYEAREFGVESAMAISKALESLPRRADANAADEPAEGTGYYRPVDMDFYESVSDDVREILHESADVVREVSIDEAYLDVTERTAWSVAEGFARHVKERIHREVGITVSIGVAPTMSAAKIASDFEKPDGLTVVEPSEVRSFLTPLDVGRIHGVGPVTARTLREMGLETAGDVADADVTALVDRFGDRGRELHQFARGADERRVSPRGLPKSFSRESAVGQPVTSWDRKREILRTLAAAVAERATREGALYRTIGVKAVTPPFEISTRERSLSGPIDDPDLVEEIVLDLFREFEDARVRKLGVRLANLDFDAADQTDLSGWDSTDADAVEFGSDPTNPTSISESEGASGQLDLFAVAAESTESQESMDRTGADSPFSGSTTRPGTEPTDQSGGATPTIDEWVAVDDSDRTDPTTGESSGDGAESRDGESRDASNERTGPPTGFSGQTTLSDFS